MCVCGGGGLYRAHCSDTKKGGRGLLPTPAPAGTATAHIQYSTRAQPGAVAQPARPPGPTRKQGPARPARRRERGPPRWARRGVARRVVGRGCGSCMHTAAGAVGGGRARACCLPGGQGVVARGTPGDLQPIAPAPSLPRAGRRAGARATGRPRGRGCASQACPCRRRAQAVLVRFMRLRCLCFFILRRLQAGGGGRGASVGADGGAARGGDERARLGVVGARPP